ncbi:juvenile hormone epoxide hydrolase-like [Euwallacea fornicatus]|uniref:juvenile hormone epoxide hydrolase-like n=1 Tax=Euwallacea fornicatus TaxID=995702 RepID=UPI0033905351
MGRALNVIFLLIAVSGSYIYMKLSTIPPRPIIEERWWGPGSPHRVDSSIKPFRIDFSNEIISDLKSRLNATLPFQPPLEGTAQQYGMNTYLLKTIVDYWKNQYDFKEREQFLNQFPQFKTNIQGLDIHFIHAKPQKVPQGVEVVPLLIIHGWPGSVREFYEMIPYLITPKNGKDYVFEVIAPSLPGYGFSDGAARPGLNPAQIAQLFNTLMKRLKLDRYYVQGGDWGAAISRDAAILYPENVIAIHRNWCLTVPLFEWRTYVGALYPSLFFTSKEIAKLYPIYREFMNLIMMTGYFHIQATKPDTVGVALRDSPAGLAAYILEKFTSDINSTLKDLPVEVLFKKFTLDQLLDNLMMYWVPRSITTAVRLYAEYFVPPYSSLKLDKIPIEIPAGCVRAEYEVTYSPEVLIRANHKNLIHLVDYDSVGHFAAFEAPELLGNDIIEFVSKVRQLSKVSMKL